MTMSNKLYINSKKLLLNWCSGLSIIFQFTWISWNCILNTAVSQNFEFMNNGSNFSCWNWNQAYQIHSKLLEFLGIILNTAVSQNFEFMN